MYDLARFGLSDVTRVGAEFRRLSAGASSMEEVAGRIVRTLYDSLGTGDVRACALVRMFVTVPFAQLDDEQRAFALALLGGAQPVPSMKCLTLLATVGDEPQWNDRRASENHQAIPLPSPYVVERAPMIAQLIREFGMDLGSVVRPSGDVVRALGGKSYGVFHVENAPGSPYIPAQEGFVDRYGIRSVLGFGGLLPEGDLFGVILFSRVHVPVGSADRFRSLALDLRSCLIPYGEAVFAPQSAGAPSSD